MLERGLNGEPDRLGDAVGLMWSVRWQAEALMRVPIGHGDTAGPTFQWSGLNPAWAVGEAATC